MTDTKMIFEDARVPHANVVGEVGVGLARVEQGRMMAQLGASPIEPRKLGLLGLQVAMIAAPCEQAVGPGYGMAGEGADDDQRQCGAHRAPDQSDIVLVPRHSS